MITVAEIAKLAELARISVSEGEKEGLRKDIGGILAYVGQIQEVSAKVSAEKNADLPVNVMREDGTPHEGGIFTDALLATAPHREGSYIKVKKIL